MKNKTAMLFLIVGAMTLFFACQKDDVQPEKQIVGKQLPDLKATIFRGNSIIKSNRKLNTAIQKFSPKHKNDVLQRTIYSETYDLSIDTTVVQQIETSDYVSYTFFVERESPSSAILENYVFTVYENDSISQMLIAYPIVNTSDYITYDIPNAMVTYIQDDLLIYQRSTTSCASLMEFQEGVCVSKKCKDNIHSVFSEDLAACIWNGIYAASYTCTEGGWVDTGCINHMGGRPDGPAPPDGSSGGSQNDNDPVVVVVVPLPDPTPAYQGILNCINGMGGLDQTDNTIIDEALLASLNLTMAQTSQMINYLADNSCSEQAQADVIEELLAIFDEQIFIDEEFENNACLKSVYDAMGKASTFNNYLKNFEAEFSVAHLRFSSSTTLPSGTNAETSAPENYLIEITFNENKLNRPRLSVARTFIHEIIHAEIFRKLLAVAQHPSIQLDQNQIIQLRNDYPGLYDYYMRWKWNLPQTPSSAQHEAMAQHYRDIIKQALEEYDGTQTEMTYNALTWIGLMGSGTFNETTGLYSNSTQAWRNLNQTERLNIINTQNVFNSANPNCQ